MPKISPEEFIEIARSKEPEDKWYKELVHSRNTELDQGLEDGGGVDLDFWPVRGVEYIGRWEIWFVWYELSGVGEGYGLVQLDQTFDSYAELEEFISEKDKDGEIFDVLCTWERSWVEMKILDGEEGDEVRKWLQTK